ncbi:MAG: HAMP domain-containing sensor histidine kinase [Bacteroidota bacterium]
MIRTTVFRSLHSHTYHLKHKLPLILALLGFGLLLFMEGLWLRGTFRDTRASLQQQAYQAVVEEVRQLEDSLVQHLLIGPHIKQMESSNGGRSIQLQGHIDTNANVAFQAIMIKSNEQHFEDYQKNDTSVLVLPDMGNLKLWSKKTTGESVERSGSISVFVSQKDSMHWMLPGQQVSVRPFLEKRVETAVKAGNLPGTYTLLDVKADSEAKGLEVYRYHDISSEERIAVIMDHPVRLVVSRMLPEIMLSVLLLLILGMAFFFVFRSLRRERQLIQLKQDFMSNMTHELKTPITTVGVAIEALRNFKGLEDPVRTEEYLSISQQELQRLGILVDRVLKMAQFEGDRPQLRLENLDFQHLLEDILLAMKLQFQQVKAKVSTRIEGNGFRIEGDKSHLASVLYNLLDNALKYSPGEPQIDISLRHQTDSLELRVSDRGMGIPQEFQDKVFDRFFRVPQGDRHNTKGHGLGLSYVAAVIRQHQGHISVQSQPGQGSTFTFTLPTNDLSA